MIRDTRKLQIWYLQYRKIQVSHFELRCVIIYSGLSYLILDVLYLSFKTI